MEVPIEITHSIEAIDSASTIDIEPTD